MSSYIERELKFDIEPRFVVPDVAALLPPGGRTESATEHLRSQYYDTADHALLRARMTLRRRTGTTDTGWQFKVPLEPFREEIRVDSSDEEIPQELSTLLVGVVRGQPLLPVATLTTERSVTRLLDADGTVLAEIDDDTVKGTAGGDTVTATTWREVEAELGGGQPELLTALGKRLRRAGARRATSTSKLARALAAVPTEKRPDRSRAAGDVLAAYLTEQQHVILAGDLALRRGQDSVIHKTRVATRRLRSILRVFDKFLDAERASALDAELRWFAAELGQVRDRQVLRIRLDALVDEVDESLLLGPVRARVDTELAREQAEHWVTVQAEITGPRYLAMLAELDAWVQDPPFTTGAHSRADALVAYVDRAEHTVSRRLAKATASGDIHRLHGARKAAKRARYAAEAAAPVIGATRAARHARRYKKLQDLLGEHQDSLVSAAFLRRLGASAGNTPGENGFAFGLLYEREQRRAHAARVKAQRTAKKYR